MFSSQEHPHLLRHPDWTDQQVHRSLKERRTIAFNPVPQEQQRPSADEKSRSPDPFRQDQQSDSAKYHRNPDAVQQLVPDRSMFVVVLRHVVRQIQSAPPCGDSIVEAPLYTQWREIARGRGEISSA
jgi:hypothetical protein